MEYRLEQTIESRMRANAESQTTLLKISTEQLYELVWEHAQEFRYQGEMYDVVSSYQESDTLFIECWKDHEETELKNKLYNQLVQENPISTRQREHTSRFFTFLQSLVYSKSIPAQCFSIQFPGKSQSYHNSFFYQRSGLSPPSPPPE